ncbi:MAG: DUF6786 family protein [Armatimonadota bacterium]
MNTKLVDVLNKAGKVTETYITPDGSELLVLPYGGRVLGLYAPGSDTNFFWTNTALESADTARTFYGSDEWQNSGGDRTWLAPELDLFFPNNPGDIDDYFQPRQLDPGSYLMTIDRDEVRLVNRLTVTPFSTKLPVEAEITKSFTPAPNPLRYSDMNDIEYAGYTQTASLIILNPDDAGDVRLGLWSLVQMPHGGELLVPLFSPQEPAVYFGEIPDGDLHIDDHLLRYRMTASGGQKIGVKATASTGRAGYIYQSDGLWSLIIRCFDVNPSGEYIDMPWNQPAAPEYVFQACNVNNEMGQFDELEYHAPAIGGKSGIISCEDKSQLWAFRGSRGQIIEIAGMLLSPDIS